MAILVLSIMPKTKSSHQNNGLNYRRLVLSFFLLRATALAHMWTMCRHLVGIGLPLRNLAMT